jgi:chromosome segregation ATPase
MNSSLRELGAKLVSSHSQHCQSAAQSEATIHGLNEKVSKTSGELAMLRAAVETAALEQERAESQIAALRRDLEASTSELREVCATNAALIVWLSQETSAFSRTAQL